MIAARPGQYGDFAPGHASNKLIVSYWAAWLCVVAIALGGL